MARKNLHHIRLDKWMSDGIRSLNVSHGDDSKVIRAAVAEYLEKYDISEEAWLLNHFQSTNPSNHQ